MHILFTQLLMLCGDRGRAFADIPAFQGLQRNNEPVRVVTEAGAHAAFVYAGNEIIGTVVFSVPLRGDLNYIPGPVPADAHVRVCFGAPGVGTPDVVAIPAAGSVHALARGIAAVIASKLPQAQEP